MVGKADGAGYAPDETFADADEKGAGGGAVDGASGKTMHSCPFLIHS